MESGDSPNIAHAFSVLPWYKKKKKDMAESWFFFLVIFDEKKNIYISRKIHMSLHKYYICNTLPCRSRTSTASSAHESMTLFNVTALHGAHIMTLALDREQQSPIFIIW